jgi:hypothetical protein
MIEDTTNLEINSLDEGTADTPEKSLNNGDEELEIAGLHEPEKGVNRSRPQEGLSGTLATFLVLLLFLA